MSKLENDAKFWTAVMSAWQKRKMHTDQGFYFDRLGNAASSAYYQRDITRLYILENSGLIQILSGIADKSMTKLFVMRSESEREQFFKTVQG